MIDCGHLSQVQHTGKQYFCTYIGHVTGQNTSLGFAYLWFCSRT